MTKHPNEPTTGTASIRRTGFQPSSRRRNRIAAGIALGAVAIGGNVIIYSGLNSADPVVQVTEDVPAGTQITADMLGTVDVEAPATVNLVPGADLTTLVGQHAKVRLVAGSLVTFESVQQRALIAPGNAVVAIEVADGALPVGLRERVPVTLVVPGATADSPNPLVIAGEVVALPTTPENAIGTRSLSVELAAADAPLVAAADDVRVVLTEQG